jgi:O-antigen/teichoic acid export membrane protein
VLPFGIAKAFFTRMCQAWENDRAQHTRLVLTSMRIGSAIGACIAIGLCVTAHELIAFLWPGKWPVETAITLSITAFLPWLQTMSLPLGDALASSSQYALRTRILALYAVVALLVFVLLTHWYGLVGTATAAVGIEVILLGAYLLVARSGLRRRAATLIARQVVLLALGIAVGLVLKPFLPVWMPLVNAGLAAGLGALAYLGALLLLDQDIRTMVHSKVLRRA